MEDNDEEFPNDPLTAENGEPDVALRVLFMHSRLTTFLVRLRRKLGALNCSRGGLLGSCCGYFGVLYADDGCEGSYFTYASPMWGDRHRGVHYRCYLGSNAVQEHVF